jgi:hypothetical protein
MAGMGEEGGDPIRPVGLDRVDWAADDLHGLCPGHPDEPTLSARLVVATPTLRIVDNIGPGQHRVLQSLLGFPIHLQQDFAGVRILDPSGRLGVPGEGGTTRAAARLILRSIGADGRIESVCCASKVIIPSRT